MQFRQSNADFPMMVTLGEKKPSWGINRWNGNNGLRFMPLDDEGFVMRGDRQRLLYKGRRRSHRFTILDDTAFEYDCILEREPETNIVCLLMEGAEHFDFFRQPDFVKDPFLRGSYAVYKKETLIGEGTGKLCHIHRPLVIDARGRRCWGDLAVVENELRITIPEQWLGEAAYPVVVDPVVGTSTIGAHFGYYEEFEEDYLDDEGCWIEFDNFYSPFLIGNSLATNRCQIPQDMSGKATAYLYLTCHKPYNGTFEGMMNYNNTICPCMYSNSNNAPLQRLSANELYFDHDVNATTKPNGWRSATFSTNQVVNAGAYVWFGVHCGDFQPRFDYGAKCYICLNDDRDCGKPPPDIYPVWNDCGGHEFVGSDIIISMYFSYTPMQNYVRTITQGVKLSDSRKLKTEYKRITTQTTEVNTILLNNKTFFRKCAMTVYNAMNVSSISSYLRKVVEHIKLSTDNSENRSMFRKCTDDVNANSVIKRFHHITHRIQDGLKSYDTQSVSILFVRTVPDSAIVTDKIHHLGSFIRGLLVTAGSIAKTTQRSQYHRFQKDRVQAQGAVFRGLLLFVRIVTKVLFRDYLLGRFLKARQELALKSIICREVTLESKLS
jgi:hypothetical protein